MKSPKNPPEEPAAPSSSPYTIEFYEEEDGTSPVWRWIFEDLSPTQRRAVTAALEEILAVRGPNVCADEFGKALGGSLSELRLRQSAEDILVRAGKKPLARPLNQSPEKILLRIFFHAHGQKMILLLGGYDKLKRPSKQQQNDEIALARKRLKRWKILQAQKVKALKKKTKTED
jgi:hypothetical protein